MLRLFRRGEHSREALIETHGGLVYGLCCRLAPRDADDCFQEIWEKVFRALPDFDPGGSASMRTWIGTIARRHLIDHHRRRKVRGEPVEAGELLDSEPLADARLAATQSQRRLEAGLARLPAAQRRVLIGHHLQGVSLADLAGEEGVAVGTIKSRLHRGRERLAQILEAP